MVSRSRVLPPRHLTSTRTAALTRFDHAAGRQLFPLKGKLADRPDTPGGRGQGPGQEQGQGKGQGQDRRQGADRATGGNPAAGQTADATQGPDAQGGRSGPGGARGKDGGPPGAGDQPPGQGRPDAQGDTPAAADTAAGPGSGGQGARSPVKPPEPPMPMIELPDLSAIRSPVVRGPPPDAELKSREILARTGTTPSQHHANIQSAVFRVSEATRQAQREMVQSLGSMAVNTRWSIEEMAVEVDAVVARCTATVAGAARAALSDIDSAAKQHEAVIRQTALTGDEDMSARRDTTSQKIVDHLNKSGAGELDAVHKAMGTAFADRGDQYKTAAKTITAGPRPTLLSGPPGTKSDFDWAEKSGEQATEFEAEAKRLARTLPVVAAGGSGIGGTGDPYYQAYVSFKQAVALPEIGKQARTDWGKGIDARATSMTSVAAKNQFYLSMLGIVAPSAKAMKTDEKKFKDTLNKTVLGNQKNMKHAKFEALRAFKKTHFGVQNFFDPANPNSMPAKVITGLRDNGVLIREGLLAQARAYEANIRASAAPLAAAYPELIDRLRDMLDGDDLMNADLMMPRIDGVSGTVQALLEGHLDLIRGQSRDAISQTRSGLDSQIASLWNTVDGTLGTIAEQKLKSLFHFGMEEALFTGKFNKSLKASIESVSGYAVQAGRRLMAPIAEGRKAGEKVERAVVNHFNGALVGEHKNHLEAVATLKDQSGFKTPLGADDAAAPGGKPLPRIHRFERDRLIGAMDGVATGLPEPKTKEMLVCGAVAVGGAIAAVPSGGTSLIATGGAIGGLYFAWSSLPSKSKVSTALGGLEWPGALALNAIWYEAGMPKEDARTRVEKKAGDDSDWNDIKDFFSTSKQTAVDAKASIVENAGWFTGINDDAIEAITQSLNASERALLSPAQIRGMSDSIRWNLSGLQEERTLAYLDGDRARALAIRFKEAITTARRQGDDAVDGLGQDLARLIEQEMQAPGYTGHISDEGRKALEDRMYVALAARIPPGGDASRSVSYRPPAGAPQLRQSAQPVPEGLPPDQSAAQLDQRRSALLDGVAASGYRTPDQSDVDRAKSQVQRYITRDYAQFDTTWSQLFDSGQDDWLAEDIARMQGFDDLPTEQTWTGRTIKGGLLIDRMRDQTRRNVENFIIHGVTSPQYRDGLGSSILQTAGQGVFGTTQAEFVNLLNRVEDPDFNLAKHRYEALRDDPGADPDKLAAALRIFEAAKVRRDRSMIAMARELTGNADGPMSIDEARDTVRQKIDQAARRFHPGLVRGPGSAGQEIVDTGRIGLRRGVDVAKEGAGTYDDLLMQVTGRRHKDDIAAANLDRAELGLDGAWWGETSGDQAQQLEINLEGVPENDADRIRIANIRTRHDAIDGTGYISALTMANSWQKDAMYSRHARFGTRAHDALQAFKASKDGAKLPAEWRDLTPEELVPLGGDPHPVIAQYLMGDDGRLLGTGPSIDMLAAESALANKSYRDEIGRQESFFTGAITAIVVVVSIILLLVPGVNVGAAAVLTALLGGAATIGVKAGMRGNRYGWEEAAVDVGRTAIEAATAGAGAAMGGAVKAGTPVLGRLAAAGQKLETAFGKIGAAAAREGITNAVSGVAMTAMDDRTWARGGIHGMGELMKAGVKGSVTGAISGAVSEGVTKGLNARFARMLGEGADSAIGASARAAGARAAGRHAMMQEALSGLAGTTLSEASAIAMDLADGKMKLDWGEIARRLGTAGLREVLSGAARGAIQHKFREVHDREMGAILRRGGDMSPSEAAFMRKLAISAGIEQYGRDRENAYATTTRTRHDFTAQQAYNDSVRAAARMLADLPPAIRSQLGGMSADHLQQISALYARGAGGFDGDIAELRVTLATMYPGLDPVHLIRTIETQRKADKVEARAVKAREAATTRTHKAARRVVLSGLPPGMRSALGDAPVARIAALPRAAQRLIAEAVARGDGPEAVDALVARVRGADADGDGAALTREIEGLLGARGAAEAEMAAAKASRRDAVREMLPEGMQARIDVFSDREIAFLHRLRDGPDPSPAQRRNMELLIAARLGDVDGAEILGAMQGQARTARQARAEAEAATARSERLGLMGHIPPDLRPLLSHLPDRMILMIALAQAGQMRLSRGDIMAMARGVAGQGRVEATALTQAIRKSIRAPAMASQGGFFARVAQRRALLEFVPRHLRAAVRDTPMLTVPDALFFAYVKSMGDGQENAVTLRIGDRPVVLIREGAPRQALGEEGWHVVQMRDPAFAARLNELSEEALEAWPMLPAAEKARLARIAIEADLAAQMHMISVLDQRLDRMRDAGGRARLSARRGAMMARATTLQRRAMELAGLSPQALRAMDRGQRDLPAWLQRPARLFDETDDMSDRRKRDAEPTDAEATPAPVQPTPREALLAKAEYFTGTRDQPEFDTLRTALDTASRDASPEAMAALHEILSLAHHITRSHRDKGVPYINGLTALIRAVGDGMDPVALAGLKDLLAMRETHATFLLNAIHEMHGKGALDWLGTGETRVGAGRALMAYLKAYMELGSDVANASKGFPSSLGKLLDNLNSGTWGSYRNIWPAVAAILTASAKAPVRTLRDAPKLNDQLGFFVKAMGYAGNKSALEAFFATWTTPDFSTRIGEKFRGEFLPPARQDKTFEALPVALQRLSEDAMSNKPIDESARALFDEMGLPADQFRDFLALVTLMADTLRADGSGMSGHEDLGLFLDNIIEMTRTENLNWLSKAGDDVSKLTPDTTLTFRDFHDFIANMGSGSQADRLLVIQGLPLFARIFHTPTRGLTERMFWQIKQFAHPNRDAAFSVPGRQARLRPRDIGPVSAVTKRMKQAYDAVAAAGARLRKLRQAKAPEADVVLTKGADFEKTAKKSVRTGDGQDSGEKISVTESFDVFRFDENVPLSKFLSMLERLYSEVHGRPLSEGEQRQLFVFIEAVTAAELARKDAPEGAGSDTGSKTPKPPPGLSLRLGYSEGGILSIYVGTNVSITIDVKKAADTGTPDGGGDAPAQKGETTYDVTFDSVGGESYPPLINKLLTSLTGDGTADRSGLIEHFMAELVNGATLRELGLDARTIRDFRLLKTIAAGSEILRDEMALPALLLSLYAMRGLGRGTGGGEGGHALYPAQILFGHAFFRRTRISAFASHVVNRNYDDALTKAGFGPGDLKTFAKILALNLSGNQVLGGGLFVPTLPLFLSTRITAGKLASGEVDADNPGRNPEIVRAILDRYDKLLDLAIQRYLIDKGLPSDPETIANLNADQRKAFMDEIIAQMIKLVLPELDPEAGAQQTTDGPDAARDRKDDT